MYINIVGLKSLLLCAKFQGNLTDGSGRRRFLKDFPYMGMSAILVW